MTAWELAKGYVYGSLLMGAIAIGLVALPLFASFIWFFISETYKDAKRRRK